MENDSGTPGGGSGLRQKGNICTKRFPRSGCSLAREFDALSEWLVLNITDDQHERGSAQSTEGIVTLIRGHSLAYDNAVAAL